LARLNEQYTSVVDHAATAQVDKNNNAGTRLACQTVLSAMTILTTFLTILAALPFTRTMKVLISQLQSNTLYVGDFARALESAGSHLTKLYTNGDTAWSGGAFAEWIAVKHPAKQPHKPGSKLHNRLPLAKHNGTPVVHLEDEAGEATLMTATAIMLGAKTTSDSAAGAERLPVDAATCKKLHKGVLCVPQHVSMITFTCMRYMKSTGCIPFLRHNSSAGQHFTELPLRPMLQACASSC
jgi:hypothetical protein